MSLTKDQITQWYQAIRDGDLSCPFEECTWTFFTSFELADHLVEDCEFGRYTGDVPCTHCNEELVAEQLKYHWRDKHRDEVTVLNLLDKGLQSTCPNYMCSKSFSGNFDGCKEYTKHSIVCRPLFLCHKCKGEYKSKLELQKHFCKGGQKRDRVHVVSKAEIEIDRDTNKRPSLSVDEELQHIAEWKKAIKSAIFCCPVPSCTKQFFVVSHFLQHLTLESKIDDIINKIDMVECPFCASVINWLLLCRHINDYHRDVSKVLNMLKSGLETSCPNYKCTSKEVYTVNTGIEYLKHAVTCRPLYQCVYCGTETKQESYLKRHLLTCKRDIKEEYSEFGMDSSKYIGDVSCEAFMKRKTNCVGNKIVKKYNTMQSKVKKVGFARHAKTDSKMRKTMALRKRKPNILKDKLKSEEIEAKLKEMNCNELKEDEGTIEEPRVPSVKGSSESQSPNKELDNSFTDETSELPSTEKLSPRTAYRKSYLRRAIKKKVLQSMFDTSMEMTESTSTPGVEKMPNEKLLAEWTSRFAKGIFTCGNLDCLEVFVLPESMIEHMTQCHVDDANEYILQTDKLDCLWCKQDVGIKRFKDHADQHHSMIMETLHSATANYVCPNYDCNTIFDSVEEFLQHSVECPTCIVCVDCKLTFTSEEECNNHDCLANDEMFRKRSLNMWRNQIRSGHLQCPNISCSSKYFYYEEFVKHIHVCARKSRFCKYALSEGEMPCSYCAETMTCDDYGKHFVSTHPEILKELQKVESGKNVKCLNYKCRRTFDDPFKYFHHLSVCRPLYLCSVCAQEFSGYKSYSSHPCVDNKILPEELDEWYEDLKNAVYRCPSEDCGKTFKTFEGLIPHLKACKKGSACQTVLQKDAFYCCCCKEEFTVDGFIGHFTESHKQIMMQLLKMQNTSSSRCLNSRCKKVFVDRGKLLQHNIECLKNSCKACGETCKNFSTCYKTAIKKKPSFNLKSWHEEVKQGIMSCPNRCSMIFNDLGFFINHLRHCQHRNIASKAVLIPLPCLICKSTYPVADIYEHFKSSHTLVFAQLKLIEQGVCIHCPNEDCKEPFTDSALYLQHVATICQLGFHCEFCSNYFQSQDLLDSHECLGRENSGAPEGSLQGTTLSSWYVKIMKGDLRCPNSNCGAEFVLPRNFIDHIRMCREGQEYVSVLNRQELPCCFCKIYVPLEEYCSHLSSCHKKGSNHNIKVRCDQTAVLSKKVSDRLDGNAESDCQSNTGMKTSRGSNTMSRELILSSTNLLLYPSGRKVLLTQGPVTSSSETSSKSVKQIDENDTRTAGEFTEKASQRDVESSNLAGNCKSTSDLVSSSTTEGKDQRKYAEGTSLTSCDNSDQIDFINSSREARNQNISKNMGMNDDRSLHEKTGCSSEMAEEEQGTIKSVKFPVGQVSSTPANNNSGNLLSPISSGTSNLHERMESVTTPTAEKSILDDKQIKLLVKSLLKKKKRKSKQLRRSEPLPAWTVTEKPKLRKEESSSAANKFSKLEIVGKIPTAAEVPVNKSDASTVTLRDVSQKGTCIGNHRDNRGNRDITDIPKPVCNFTGKQRLEEGVNQDVSTNTYSVTLEQTTTESEKVIQREAISLSENLAVDKEVIVDPTAGSTNAKKTDSDIFSTGHPEKTEVLSDSGTKLAEISEADYSGLSQTDEDNEDEMPSKSKTLLPQPYRVKRRTRVKFKDTDNESDSSQKSGTGVNLSRKYRRSRKSQEEEKRVKAEGEYSPRVEKKYSLRSSSGDEDCIESRQDRETVESCEESKLDPQEKFLGALMLSRKGGRSPIKHQEGVDSVLLGNSVARMQGAISGYIDASSRSDTETRCENGDASIFLPDTSAILEDGIHNHISKEETSNEVIKTGGKAKALIQTIDEVIKTAASIEDVNFDQANKGSESKVESEVNVCEEDSACAKVNVPMKSAESETDGSVNVNLNQEYNNKHTDVVGNDKSTVSDKDKMDISEQGISLDSSKDATSSNVGLHQSSVTSGNEHLVDQYEIYRGQDVTCGMPTIVNCYDTEKDSVPTYLDEGLGNERPGSEENIQSSPSRAFYDDLNVGLGFVDSYIFDEEERYLPSDIKKTLRSQILGDAFCKQNFIPSETTASDNNDELGKPLDSRIVSTDMPESGLQEMVDGDAEVNNNLATQLSSDNGLTSIIDKLTSTPITKEIFEMCQSSAKVTLEKIPIYTADDGSSYDEASAGGSICSEDQFHDESGSSRRDSNKGEGTQPLNEEASVPVLPLPVTEMDDVENEIAETNQPVMGSPMFSDLDESKEVDGPLINPSYLNECIDERVEIINDRNSLKKRNIPKYVEQGIQKVASWLDIKARISCTDPKSRELNSAVEEDPKSRTTEIAQTDYFTAVETGKRVEETERIPGKEEMGYIQRLNLASDENSLPRNDDQEEAGPQHAFHEKNNLSNKEDISDKEGIVKEPFAVSGIEFKKTLDEHKMGEPTVPSVIDSSIELQFTETSTSQVIDTSIELQLTETTMNLDESVQSFQNQTPLMDDYCIEGDSLVSTQDDVIENNESEQAGVKPKVSRRFKYGKLTAFEKKGGKAEKRRPAPNLPAAAKLSCIKVSEVHTEKAKTMDADILKLMSLNNQNTPAQDDEPDLLNITSNVSSCVTSTPNHVEAVNQLFQIPAPIPATDLNNEKTSDPKVKENFIDFKIEASDYVPEGMNVESDANDKSDPVVITFDSQKELQGMDDAWKEVPTAPPQHHLSNTLADNDSSMEIPSVSYHNKTLDIPHASEDVTSSPLKEMLFLIPKDGFDVRASLGESDLSTPCKLPGLPKVSDMHAKKFPCRNQSPMKVGMERCAKLSQMEETEVIENELQDLLSTLPSKSQSPKSCIQLWKAKLFSYNMHCQFVECQQTFHDPASLIQHMRMCKDTSEKNSAMWEIMADVVLVCPECNKRICVDAYDLHYKEKHPVLLSMLKELGERKKVNCRSYKCNAEPTTPIDCVNHFNQCGVAVKSAKTKFCEMCRCVFKTKKALQAHVCGMQQVADGGIVKDISSDLGIALTASANTLANGAELLTNMGLELNSGGNDLLRLNPASDSAESASDGRGSSLTGNKSSEDITGIKNVADLSDSAQSTENLKILQDFCENILTQSGMNINTDIIADETTDILASLADLKKTTTASPSIPKHPSQRFNKLRTDSDNSVPSSDTDSNEPLQKYFDKKYFGERPHYVDGVCLANKNVCGEVPSSPCRGKGGSKLIPLFDGGRVDDALVNSAIEVRKKYPQKKKSSLLSDDVSTNARPVPISAVSGTSLVNASQEGNCSATNSMLEHGNKTKVKKKKVKSDVLSDGTSVRKKHRKQPETQFEVLSKSTEKVVTDNTKISMVDTLKSFNAIQAQSFSPHLSYSEHLPSLPADLSVNLTSLPLSLPPSLSSGSQNQAKKPCKKRVQSSSQTANEKCMSSDGSEISCERVAPKKRGRPRKTSVNYAPEVSVSGYNAPHTEFEVLSECETLHKKPRTELSMNSRTDLPLETPLGKNNVIHSETSSKCSESKKTKKLRTSSLSDHNSSSTEVRHDEVSGSSVSPKKKKHKKSDIPNSQLVLPFSEPNTSFNEAGSSISSLKKSKSSKQSNELSSNKLDIRKTNILSKNVRTDCSTTSTAKPNDADVIDLINQVDRIDPPAALPAEEVSAHQAPVDNSPVTEEGGEEPKPEEDLCDPSIWLSYVVKYNYYCPTDDCWEPFYRGSTMVHHMRRCVRRSGDYINKKLHCLECNYYTTVKEYTKHLKAKHLLLHWYLEELERGNWVICQNYKCAKYMEDINECVEHFRKCDYLWKCKYCDIEYNVEKDVERHHCRTTSEDEYELDAVSNNTCENNNNDSNNNNNTEEQSGDQDGNQDKENKAIACKNIQSADNNNTCDELGSNNAHECVAGEDLVENRNTNFKLKPKSKKGGGKGARRKTSRLEEAALKVKGKEIEKIIKSIKENRKKDRSLTEEALMQWQENFKRFYFSCPLECCEYTSYFPTYTHVKTCDLFEDELQRDTVLKQIESLRFECMFDFCKQKDKSMPSMEYARHLLSSHKMLLIYLKALRAGEKVTCLNFKCSKEIRTIDEAVLHYVSCRFLWQCDKCLVEYKTESSVKTHSCVVTNDVDDIKEEPDEADGKRKRKSAARSSNQENPAMTSMTQISS